MVWQQPSQDPTRPIPDAHQDSQSIRRFQRHLGIVILDLQSRNYYFRGMKAIVSEKGQVTIPKTLRQRLGIRSGQVLDFKEERGKLVAVKQGMGDPVSDVTGILKTGLSTDQMMRLLRGPKEKR